MGLEALVGGLVARRGVLADVIVVVDIAGGLIQELLFAGDGEGVGDVELLVVGAVGTLQVGIFLGMALVVRNELATKAGDQLTQLSYF